MRGGPCARLQVTEGGQGEILTASCSFYPEGAHPRPCRRPLSNSESRSAVSSLQDRDESYIRVPPEVTTSLPAGPSESSKCSLSYRPSSQGPVPSVARNSIYKGKKGNQKSIFQCAIELLNVGNQPPQEVTPFLGSLHLPRELRRYFTLLGSPRRHQSPSCMDCFPSEVHHVCRNCNAVCL